MRSCFGLLAGFAVWMNAALAQPPFVSKPIDTNKIIVQPGDTMAGAGSSTFRTLTRSVASAIESNGFVRTINNLLGRRAQPAPVQRGFSPLPPVSSFQSTRYPNSFQPLLPTTQRVGRSPTQIIPSTSGPQR